MLEKSLELEMRTSGGVSQNRIDPQLETVKILGRQSSGTDVIYRHNEASGLADFAHSTVVGGGEIGLKLGDKEKSRVPPPFSCSVMKSLGMKIDKTVGPKRLATAVLVGGDRKQNPASIQHVGIPASELITSVLREDVTWSSDGSNNCCPYGRHRGIYMLLIHLKITDYFRLKAETDSVLGYQEEEEDI
ncbi:hypothetical protein Bbelb_113220 [Branchiostoma belcheri]|nr:hypothetical protein Bbelb_113220 [Branchiostoma belcheri]